ncbi:hypothetical protein HJC23_006067 [Cyclotella cryptica]|uniref:Uncharacterized protein n=1 Tax=Cyclotella cryptica TaxID=29204 RepID=A0ABD3PTJ5_9STRA|eukprot:CCRYP_011372-RA/>CCRYP_011372-RA protein AED:0.45 eAED:0.45 QI:0/-1/0/1/-1/1/1/0/358
MSHSVGDHRSLPASSSSKDKDAKSVALSADGISGGRRNRPSVRSLRNTLRNTDVLRDAKPPALPSGNDGETAEGPLSRAHSEKLHLKKPASKHVQRSNSHELAQKGLSLSDRAGKTSKRHSTNEVRSNSLRFRRVDVEWTPGQLDGPRDETVEVAPQENEDTSLVESLQMEIMDLRPSTHPSIIDSSFISIMNDEHVREMFRVALGVSERDEDHPASHWDWELADQEHPTRTEGRRPSWNSCANNTVSIMANSYDSVSNLSMSGRTLGSRDTRGASLEKDLGHDASPRRSNVHYNKYIKPMVMVIVLTVLTASLIYIFTGGLLKEESESWTYETRNVARNWVGEGESGGEILERGGGR